MLLYIIRHGDPIYEPDSLTEKGRLQAQALARRLAVHGLDRIYASPLIRAQQTARPTCELLHKEAVILPWTSEQAAWDDLAFTDEAGRTDWSLSLIHIYILIPLFVNRFLRWIDKFLWRRLTKKGGGPAAAALTGACYSRLRM